MDELSLHLLDLIQNSISAGATIITVSVEEDTAADVLVLSIHDNGKGMDKAECCQVVDPFYTSRSTRDVGLGLALIDMTCRQCNGYLNIESALNVGTKVTAVFQHSHLDRPPLGNIASTIKVLIAANPHLEFEYYHNCNGKIFDFKMSDIKCILGDTSLNHPEFIHWLGEYLEENLLAVCTNLDGGNKDENRGRS